MSIFLMFATIALTRLPRTKILSASAGVYGGTAAHKTILAGLQTLFRQGDLILLELVGNPP